jgi:hypothetical protein
MTRITAIYVLAVIAGLLWIAGQASAHLPKYCGHDYKYVSNLTANFFQGHYQDDDHYVETWTWSPTARQWRYNDNHRWNCGHNH